MYFCVLFEAIIIIDEWMMIVSCRNCLKGEMKNLKRNRPRACEGKGEKKASGGKLFLCVLHIG